MVFSSAAFLFLFLPVFLAVYYLLPSRLRSAWILLASWFFYAWWRLDFLSLIGLTTLWTYLLGRAVASNRRLRPDRARLVCAVAVVLNIGVLAYFKYFNFGVESLNAMLAAIGATPLTGWEVVLPVGISFYVFQATSYVVDVYRGDAQPARDYLDVAAYVSLFPQLIAGPILRYKDLSRQFRDRQHSLDGFASGALRFMTGFVKKVLIADTVASIVDSVFALSAPSFLDAWLGTAAFAVQLYYDFSGYSDMAIGLGRMIGFEFAENFRAPYRSHSITEFWRRWHISLSTWLRDYLYIPLGGNRAGRTNLNLLVVMVLGGLWHGASWSFVLWGLYHGLLLVFERQFGEGEAPILRRLRGWGAAWVGSTTAKIRTVVLVMIGWVLFRAETLASAVAVFRGMAAANGFGISAELAWQLSSVSLAALVVGAVGVYLPAALRRSRDRTPRVRVATVSAVAPLFALSILKLVAESFSPFLYFRF